jgi:hypothetical protein
MIFQLQEYESIQYGVCKVMIIILLHDEIHFKLRIEGYEMYQNIYKIHAKDHSL